MGSMKYHKLGMVKLLNIFSFVVFMFLISSQICLWSNLAVHILFFCLCGWHDCYWGRYTWRLIGLNISLEFGLKRKFKWLNHFLDWRLRKLLMVFLFLKGTKLQSLLRMFKNEQVIFNFYGCECEVVKARWLSS